ncbi:MAG: FKBP-type peptidyl-prolyl cis-trans isomerase [Clostridia bacterium]|nr:FKBP-type peptidyl-prolyl cis-trans isomerase [Clostridia bacterium]
MKKLLCLALSLLMCAAIFTGCGKFDMENADLSAYVELSDISEFSYADMCAAYEAYRETLSVDLASCSLTTGYTIDFFVTAQLDGETIDAWTHNTDSDMVKGYDVYRNPSDFDYALCYNVDQAELSSNTARTVKIGEDFSFTMVISEDYEDASLAGKTVKFTVNVKKAVPAVYPDSYIADKLAAFYAAVSKSKDTVEFGDTLTMDFTGTIDGALFDGGTVKSYVIVVGEGGLIPGFEEQLVGHKLNEKFDITVTFPEDYEDENLAGKEAVFAIKIKDIYNDTALITDNTPFADMWELKYAFRVESYLDYAMVDYVQDQSTLIELPEKLVKNFEKIFKSYVNRAVAEEVLSLASKGYSYTKKEVKEMLYPDGSDVTYVEEGAKKAAYDYMIAVAILRELDMEYTEKMYQKDLKLFAEEYTEIYGETYTPEKMEELYGEEVLRTSFITPLVTEELIKRISDMPEIPG